MNMLEKQKGFTLVEITVAVVIVGMLAFVALPSFWAQIQRQQAQEAMSTMSMMRASMESCGVENSYNFANCVGASGNDWSLLNMSDPSYIVATNSGANFTYAWMDHNGSNPPASGVYYMTAKHKSNNPNTNWIEEYRTSSGMTCTANGIFKGMC